MRGRGLKMPHKAEAINAGDHIIPTLTLQRGRRSKGHDGNGRCGRLLLMALDVGNPSKLGVLFVGPYKRTIAFWGLYWGPPILGNYHVSIPRVTWEAQNKGKMPNIGHNTRCL